MKKGKGKGCCKKGFNVFLAILVFTLALALNSGNAQETIACYASFPSLIGVGSLINITFNNSQNGMENFTQIFAAIEVKSASTANSSYSLLTNASNSTNNLHINYTVDNLGVLSLEDSNDYIGRATCYGGLAGGTLGNGENMSVSSETTGRTFDRGNRPTAPTSLSPSGRQTSSKDGVFSSTVNGANTTGCTLEFEGKNPGTAIYAMTHSSNSCDLTLLNIPDQIYRYNVRATDGTNTTLSATEQIQIDVPTSTRVRGGVGAAIASGAVKVVPDKAGGLQIASNTPAGERSQGLQNAIDRTNANFQKELTKEELKKTGTGAGIGAAVGGGLGLFGFALGPLGVITVPAGAALGGFIGGMVGASR